MPEKLLAVQAWILHGVELYRRFVAQPSVRPWKEILTFLLDTSGAFWLLSKATGRLALGLHHALDRSLAELFAVVYNLALAVLFASVLVFAIYAEHGGKDNFLAYQAVGFALVYLVLGAAYAEKSGKISEYALPGYWGGLASYLFFCLRSQYLRNPATPVVYAWVTWAMHGWPGKVAAILTTAQLIWTALHRSTKLLSSSLRVLTPQRRPS